MEQLCDELELHAWKEPSFDGIKHAQDVQELVLLWQNHPEFGREYSASLIAYRRVFLRSETQGVIDRMVSEIEAYQEAVKSGTPMVALPRDSHISDEVYRQWIDLADRIRKELTQPAASSPKNPVPQSRDDILRLIDSLERHDEAARSEARNRATSLQKLRSELQRFSVIARTSSELLRQVEGFTASVDRKLAVLHNRATANRAPRLTYHRDFARRLPENPSSYELLEAAGRSLTAIPDGFAIPELEGAYENWWTIRVHEVVTTEAQAQLVKIVSDAADAKTSVDREMLVGRLKKTRGDILETVTSWLRGIDGSDLPARATAEAPDWLDRLLGKAEEQAAGRWGSQTPIDPIQQAREFGLTEDGARRHAELLRVLNLYVPADRVTPLGAFTARGQAITASRRSHSVHWPPRVVQWYTTRQTEEWEAYCRGAADRLRTLHAAYEARERDSTGWNTFVRSSPFGTEELQIISALTDRGSLSPRAVQRRGGSPSPDYLNPEIWDDLRWALDRLRSRTRSPLVDLNPYTLTRRAELPGEQREYHAALLGKVVMFETLPDVVNTKREIDRSKLAEPGMWSAPAVMEMYAGIQSEQIRAFYDREMRSGVVDAVRWYAQDARTRNTPEWFRRIVPFKQFSAPMLRLVRAEALDLARLRAQRSIRGEVLQEEFWVAVDAAR